WPKIFPKISTISDCRKTSARLQKIFYTSAQGDGGSGPLEWTNPASPGSSRRKDQSRMADAGDADGRFTGTQIDRVWRLCPLRRRSNGATAGRGVQSSRSTRRGGRAYRS